MKENLIVDEKFEVWKEDGVIRYKYYKGIIIDLDVARKIVEQRLKITQGIKTPGLVDAREGVYLMHEAKKFFATDYAIQDASAVAYLIKSHVQSIIVNSYISLVPPKVPMKVFNNERKALEFLKGYKDIGNKSNLAENVNLA